MKHRSLPLVLGLVLAASGAGAGDHPWSVVDDVLKRPGHGNSDGSWTVVLPRDDLEVKTGAGMDTPWQLGLYSFATFHGDTPEFSVVVGDTCMLAHEVQPVIDALRAGAIEVVALHNHMLTDAPRVFYLHFQGKGKATTLAETIRRAWDKLGTAKPAAPAVAAGDKAPDVDWNRVGAILEVPAASPGAGVVRFVLPRYRLDVRAIDGRAIGAGMGISCWASFFACPCGLTKVMGDICVTRAELQAVIDALRKGGVQVTAIHNHYLGTEPAIAFVHLEGEGNALALASTVRSAWNALAR